MRTKGQGVAEYVLILMLFLIAVICVIAILSKDNSVPDYIPTTKVSLTIDDVKCENGQPSILSVSAASNSSHSTNALLITYTNTDNDLVTQTIPYDKETIVWSDLCNK